jgi:hypothetical protein
MNPFFIYMLFILTFSSSCYGQKQDFGGAGLKGLSPEQLTQLAKGDIVFLTADDGKHGAKNSLIEAALVFSVSPETTWKLISKTDDQPKYINQCKEIKTITKSPGKACEVHCVGNWMLTYNYGVRECYLPESNCLYWSLDSGYPKNDLIELNGYWQFYPYGKGKTLARYGSKVSFKNVPEFVENMFKKGGVKDALDSVKKYVDSSGTYRK